MFVNGRELTCPHCRGKSFTHHKAQLNTAGMTFLELDWLNKSADTFHCRTCGRIEWFVDAAWTDGPATEPRDCPRCGTFIEPPRTRCPNCGQ